MTYTADPAIWVPLYRYESGKRVNTITDWALGEFRTRYNGAAITKEDLFHYAYAVQHNPEYRKAHETDLKQYYPHVPFYADFVRWRDWGKELTDLHIGFETVSKYPGIEAVSASAKVKRNVNAQRGIYQRRKDDRAFDGTVTFSDGSGP